MVYQEASTGEGGPTHVWYVCGPFAIFSLGHMMCARVLSASCINRFFLLVGPSLWEESQAQRGLIPGGTPEKSLFFSFFFLLSSSLFLSVPFPVMPVAWHSVVFVASPFDHPQDMYKCAV